MTSGDFLFLCDGSADVGLGHLSRCLNVATGLKAKDKTVRIQFCGTYSPHAHKLISERGFLAIKEAELGAQNVILDRYGIRQTDINEMRIRCRRLVKIDDFALHDLSDLDLVVNFRFGAEAFKYTSRRVALGLNYFPSKPEFIDLRRAQLAKHQKSISPDGNRILVFIGGGDRLGVGEQVCQAICKAVRGSKIIYLSNKSSPNTECENDNLRINLSYTPHLHTVFQTTDFVVCGGGVTKYEAGFCLIPNACLSQTEGQKEDTVLLESAGITSDLGMAEELSSKYEDFTKRLRDFIECSGSKQLPNLQARYSENSLTNVSEAILEACH